MDDAPAWSAACAPACAPARAPPGDFVERSVSSPSNPTIRLAAVDRVRRRRARRARCRAAMAVARETAQPSWRLRRAVAPGCCGIALVQADWVAEAVPEAVQRLRGRQGAAARDLPRRPSVALAAPVPDGPAAWPDAVRSAAAALTQAGTDCRGPDRPAAGSIRMEDRSRAAADVPCRCCLAVAIACSPRCPQNHAHTVPMTDNVPIRT